MATRFDLVVSPRFLQGFAANGGQGVGPESSGRVFRSKPDAKRSRLMLAGAMEGDSIRFPMRCHSVGYGMASQTQSGNAIGHAKFCSRSHRAVIRVYDSAGNVIETHEHAGEFKEP
jgi:hypothetical protein